MIRGTILFCKRTFLFNRSFISSISRKCINLFFCSCKIERESTISFLLSICTASFNILALVLNDTSVVFVTGFVNIVFEWSCSLFTSSINRFSRYFIFLFFIFTRFLCFFSINISNKILSCDSKARTDVSFNFEKSNVIFCFLNFN